VKINLRKEFVLAENTKKIEFLRTLPYIKALPEDQQFISDLIKDEYLTLAQQNTLIEYFNVENRHWRKWNGNSDFHVWVLFTNPEMCSVFDKELIAKARINIIPKLTKQSVGDLKNSVDEYAKGDSVFDQLYKEKKMKDKEEHLKRTSKTREISGYKINLINKLQEIIIGVSFPGLQVEFTKDEYETLMQGYNSKAMEEKWNIIPEDNCLHFCRSWTGDEIYRTEILHEKCEHGEYKIRTFYIERDRVSYEYIDYSMFVILILLYWVLLKRDVRHLIFDRYGKSEEEIIQLWSEFGSLLFTEEDYVEVNKENGEEDNK
jgi:hypothetical protein